LPSARDFGKAEMSMLAGFIPIGYIYDFIKNPTATLYEARPTTFLPPYAQRFLCHSKVLGKLLRRQMFSSKSKFHQKPMINDRTD
jgi:hypothetical protein